MNGPVHRCYTCMGTWVGSWPSTCPTCAPKPKVAEPSPKLRPSLLPGWRALAPVIRVLQAGQKDGRESHGWQQRPVEEHVEAMHRHWLKFIDDPASKDADDGESHLAHAISRGLFVLWHMEGKS